MRSLSRAYPHAGQRGDVVRNPIVCAAVAVGLSATFWAGLIWVAQRLYG